MCVFRLLCVEHVDKNGKPLLYLVFEYLDTDLKKFIDSHRRGPNPRPLPVSVIQVWCCFLLLVDVHVDLRHWVFIFWFPILELHSDVDDLVLRALDFDFLEHHQMFLGYVTVDRF